MGTVSLRVNLDMLKDLCVLTLYDKGEEHVFRFFAKLMFILLGVFAFTDRMASRPSRSMLRTYDGLLFAAALILVVYSPAPGFNRVCQLRIRPLAALLLPAAHHLDRMRG